ncbi:MAG: NUDIX domain-containing protein [Ktedonobacteraceae bacterium]
MSRVDYTDDPQAPKANALVPAASAIVTNREGEILLQRRSDNGLWALPGGTMEIGESISQTVIREVQEETGLQVEPVRLVGVYSNPQHVIAYADGEIRQEFSLCFTCRIVGGELHKSEESSEVVFFTPQDIEHLDMHESTRIRIKHYLEQRSHPVIS